MNKIQCPECKQEHEVCCPGPSGDPCGTCWGTGRVTVEKAQEYNDSEAYKKKLKEISLAFLEKLMSIREEEKLHPEDVFHRIFWTSSDDEKFAESLEARHDIAYRYDIYSWGDYVKKAALVNQIIMSGKNIQNLFRAYHFESNGVKVWFIAIGSMDNRSEGGRGQISNEEVWKQKMEEEDELRRI